MPARAKRKYDLKIWKWAALLAIVIAVIAMAVYLRRDSIARGIANSMLGEVDLVITDLSVDTLTPDRLGLEELVIESASGARYELFGLSMPLSASGVRLDQIVAEGLVVTYAKERDAQAMLSTTLRTVLGLPLVRPNIAVTITRVSLPGFPELTDVVWSTSAEGQNLTFKVDTINVVVGALLPEEQHHRLTISGVQADGQEVLSAELALTRDDERFDGAGHAMIRLAAWRTILGALELLPVGLLDVDAELQGPIGITLDDEQVGHAAFDAQLAAVSELQVTYRTASGRVIHVRAATLNQLVIDFAYPSREWIAGAKPMQTTVTVDENRGIPVFISALECRSGIRCTLNAHIDTQDVAWNGYSVEHVELVLPLRIDIGDETTIDISPAATGVFSGARTADIAATSVSVAAFSGTRLVVTDDAWRCRIDELRLDVDNISGVGKLRASFPVTMSELNLENSAQTIDTRLSVPPGASAYWDAVALLLPGAAGVLSIDDEQMTAWFELADGNGALTANVQLNRDLSTNSGSLSVDDARIAFDAARLSDFAPDWPYPWDIVNGSWDASLNLDWQTDDTITSYDGAMTHKLEALAGKFNNIAFVGLNTRLAATLDSVSGSDVSPAKLDIGLLDIGLPVENIVADYAIDLEKRGVLVQGLSMAALGGEFVADPFAFSAAAAANPIMLHANSIQLQLIVDLAEFEDIEMSGAVSGTLPVTIKGNKMTIENGRLESEPPGGVIRYRAGDAALDAVVPDSGLTIVTRALNNFEFDSLTADVNYTEAGDLKLQMRLSGINPDMDATQPIILNLGVENNVPQLLRSLQAIRSIEDILERETVN